MKIFYGFLILLVCSCKQSEKINITDSINFEIPTHLKSCKTLNENAFLQYQNLENELYLIILKEDEKNVLNQLKLNSFSSKKEILNKYIQQLKANYSTQFQDFKIKKEYSKNNCNVLEFNMKINFVSYQYSVVVFEKNKIYYEFYVWTLKDFETQNHEDIKNIIESITII
jgi:hypothetical protein